LPLLVRDDPDKILTGLLPVLLKGVSGIKSLKFFQLLYLQSGKVTCVIRKIC